mgnify:FL=1
MNTNTQAMQDTNDRNDPIWVLVHDNGNIMYGPEVWADCFNAQFAKGLGGTLMREREHEAPAEAPAVKLDLGASIASILGFAASDDAKTEVTGNVKRTVAEATVSEIAVERIERHERWLADAGIALPPPIYEVGTTVIDIGAQNFRTKRMAWEAQPAIEESTAMVRNIVQLEDRKDLTVQAKSLHMERDGQLTWKAGNRTGRMAVEAKGLSQLISFMRHEDSEDPVFPSAARYLLSLPPEERAEHINKGLSRATQRNVVLRTRSNPGLGADDGRALFATVSESYTKFDADKVVGVIGDALAGKGYRGEVTYDAASTRLEVNATYHADNVTDLAAGDVFKVGYAFKTRDDGSGAFKGGPTAWRNLCLNLIIIGRGKGEEFNFVHKGADRDQLLRKVQAEMRKSQTVFDRFAREWNVLRNESIANVELWGQRFMNVEDALTWAVEAKRIDVGIKNNVLVEALLAGHKAEGGNSLADMINAVTRAAHETKWGRLDAQAELESFAGRELVPVLVNAAA